MCKCPPDPKEEDRVLINLAHTTTKGHTIAGVDKCIAPLVQSLNDCGLQTIASCCGHNHQPGRISLEDGREILITNYEQANLIDKLFLNIHGDNV